MIDPLSRLAILHGTGKFGYHDYTLNYFDLLGHLRDKPLRLLEIAAGNPDRAVTLIEKTIELFPKSDWPARLRKLIEICRIAKDDAAAQRAAMRLREAVPDDPMATEVLGAALDG